MATLKISVDAKVQGKHASKRCEWVANDAEIVALMRQIEAQATGTGFTAQAVVQAALRQLPAMGPKLAPLQERGRMIHIAYFVLSQPLPNSVGFPDNARVCDVAGQQDIEAHITVRDEGFNVDLRGLPTGDVMSAH